jgi:DNA ligase-1
MQNQIKNFEVQPCGNWIISGDEYAKFPKAMWIQRKVDGIRNIMILSNEPKSLSRNNKPNYNTEEMLTVLSKYADGYVIDGELFAGSWDKTITAVKTHQYKFDKLVFYVFDIIPLSEFENKICNKTLRERDKLLYEIICRCNHPKIEYLEHEEVRSNADVLGVTKKYIEKGYEGSVLKDPDSLYGYSRGNGWYKYKEVNTFDYRITGVMEGGGRLRGRLGSLLIDVDGVRVAVGTGFTDEQRTMFWNSREQIMGKYVEVKFQQKNSSGSLRHPVFVHLREDK